MALGEVYNNNDKKKYNPTVYSPYGMTNRESTLDKTALSFTYFNGLLKIAITPKKSNSDEWDKDSEVAVYLNYNKARIFLEEIKTYLADLNQFGNVGVDSGIGLIQLSNGKEYGINGLVLSIKKLNPETGAVDVAIAYEFKEQYYYSIRNFDSQPGNGETCQFDKVYHNDLEIKQFMVVLDEYTKAMTYANAYAVVDSLKFNNSRTNTKIDLIMDKLGIEKKTFGSKGNTQKSSIFSNKEGRSYSASTIDDLENEFE